MILCWAFLIVLEMGNNQVIKNAVFDITCDDYCVSIDSGNENIHSRKVDDTITCNQLIYRHDVDIGDKIKINFYNSFEHMGLSGGIDYHYFKVTTNKRKVWSISGDFCKENLFEKVNDGWNPNENYFVIGFDSNDTVINKSETCELWYVLNICDNGKYQLNKGGTMQFIDFLLIEKSLLFHKMKVELFELDQLKGKTYYKEGGDIKDIIGAIKADDELYYEASERRITERFSFQMRIEQDIYTEEDIYFDTCSVSLVICGSNCEKCNDEKEYECEKCYDGYARKENNNTDCFDISENINYYYYDQNTDTFLQCYPTCETCTEGGTALEHNCDTCQSPFTFYYVINNNKNCVTHCNQNDYLIINSNECVTQCPSPLLAIEDIHQCVEQCPIEFPLISQIRKNCSDKCESDDYPLLDRDDSICLSQCISGKVQYNNECISECPEDTKEENGICVFDSHLIDINNTHAEIDLSFNKTIEYVENYLDEYIRINQIIYGDGFILEVYDSEHKFNSYDDVSDLDLSQCETILKTHYKIPSDESLLIVKYDVINSSSSINPIEYNVYDKEGNKLDLALCESLNTNISYPLNIDLSFAEEMSERGIDIFDRNDIFFNSLCRTYTKEGSNVLSERRKLYQNIMVCEDNCEYKGINFIERKANCVCKVKTTFDINRVINFKVEKFTSTIRSSLFIVMCYDTFLNYKDIPSSIGLWICLSILTLQIAFMNYANSKDKITLLAAFNRIYKGNPPIEESASSTNLRVVISNDGNENDTQKEEKDNTLIIKKIYLPKPFDVDNYPSRYAFILDKRNCISIFFDLLRKKFLFEKDKSSFILYGFHLSLNTFIVSLCLLFNVILYSDNEISNSYNNGFTFDFKKLLMSSLISVLIVRGIKYFYNYKKIFNTLLLDITDNRILNEFILKLIKEIKIKLVIYCVTIIMISCFCLYYIAIFCIIFSKIQIIFVLHAIISVLSIIIYDILYCTLVSTLRRISLHCKYNVLYNISLYIYKD